MAKDRGPWVQIAREDFPIHLIYFDQDDNALDDFYLREPPRVADTPLTPRRLRVYPPPDAASWRLDTDTGRTIVRRAPPDPLALARGRTHLVFLLSAAVVALCLLHLTGLVRFPIGMFVVGLLVSWFSLSLSARGWWERRAYCRWFGLR